ncbi:MAG: tetratricopeptide repeat protein [Erythrobacter sp.]
MSLMLALLLQVGPFPGVDTMPRADDPLINRPPPRRVRGRNAVVEIEGITPSSKWLQECLNQLEQDAARAHAMAQIRRAETTGADRVLANLCLGAASTELARWDDARDAFLAAREGTPPDEPRARARFAAMAGNAALEGRGSEEALALLGTARADARAASDRTLEAIALTDSARALVALERAEEALAALREATRLAPERSEGWLLQATLLRRLDQLDEAQAAIERAAALAPNDPEIGLEAGVIAVLDGRDAAAKASWESVIALDPGSPFAETARGYLAQL